MNKETREYKLVYRIYEEDDGHLVVPYEYWYGEKEKMFDDYNSLEDALEAIKNKNRGSFVILPVAKSF